MGPIASPSGIEHLEWLVVGGESGRNARPCAVSWLRGLVEDGRRAGVATFVKQLGSASVGAGHQQGKADNISAWPEDL